MKLQLGHLVPYQLYDLKVMDLYDDKRSILCGIGKTEHNYKIEIYRKETIIMTRFLSEIKPILKNLSDYKDVNSKAMNELNCDLQDQLTISELANDYISVDQVNYDVIKIMAKSHIDFNRLIPKGLAISYNELK